MIAEINSGYLSRDRAHLNGLQRKRRSRLTRIDYADVSSEAETVIAALRHHAIGGDNSSILNRIVTEWQ